MKWSSLIREILVFFVLTFIVTGLVSYLYNAVVHGQGQMEWHHAFQMATIFAIVFPLVHLFEQRK